MAIMRSMVMVVMVMIVGVEAGACAASDDDGECGAWWKAAPSSSDAWRGAVAACARAPACPVVRSCDDPRWRALADWALDEIARCFDGPCEERAACVAAALPPATCVSEQMRLEADDGEVGRRRWGGHLRVEADREVGAALRLGDGAGLVEGDGRVVVEPRRDQRR